MTTEIYLKLAVNMAKDPKVRALARYGSEGRLARDLYVQMLCYSKENLSDGFVPAEEIGILVYPDSPRKGLKQAAMLIEVGLVEEVDGGFWLPGFLKRNKSKAQVEQLSATRAEAGRRAGIRSGEVRRSQARPNQNGSVEPKHFDSPPSNTEFKEQSPPPPNPPQETSEQDAELDPTFEGISRSDFLDLTDEIQAVRPEWSSGAILGALTNRAVRERPWPIVRAAALEVARDPTTVSPRRLIADGPWWRPLKPVRGPAPEWCGQCDSPTTRHVVDEEGRPIGRCPTCHFSVVNAGQAVS